MFWLKTNSSSHANCGYVYEHAPDLLKAFRYILMFPKKHSFITIKNYLITMDNRKKITETSPNSLILGRWFNYPSSLFAPPSCQNFVVFQDFHFLVEKLSDFFRNLEFFLQLSYWNKVTKFE